MDVPPRSPCSESDLAWIGAFQLFANLACAIFSGKAFDAGYVRHLMVAGLLVYTAGYARFRLAHKQARLTDIHYTAYSACRTPRPIGRCSSRKASHAV